MPPTGGETGRMNFELTGYFGYWVDADGTGVGFDSSPGFTLPNGAMRSPDLAWVKRERWEGLTSEQRKGFAPLCPDFVLELRSPSDALDTVQAKMQGYLDNGARLGWLIDPHRKRVYIYRPQAPVTCLDNSQTISGDPVLPGFVLELGRVWNS
jgi:Uma2 family endonuclease